MSPASILFDRSEESDQFVRWVQGPEESEESEGSESLPKKSDKHNLSAGGGFDQSDVPDVAI